MRNIKVKIQACLIAEYDHYVVYVTYIDGKFSNVITIDVNMV